MPGSHRMCRRAVLGADRLVRIGRIGLGCPARARPPACVEYEAVALQNGMRQSLAFAPKPEAPKPPKFLSWLQQQYSLRWAWKKFVMRPSSVKSTLTTW